MQPGNAAKQSVKRLYDAVGRSYLGPLIRREAEQSVGRLVNEGLPQYGFALRIPMKTTAQSVLDVGTGLSSWPRLLADCGFEVAAVDEFASYWGARRPFNRHYLVQRNDIRQPRINRMFDALTCLNVMMAIEDDEPALIGMSRLVSAGGRIILSFPYNERQGVENAYDLPGSTYGQDFRFSCRIYTRADIDRWATKLGVEVAEQEYYRLFSGDWWSVGERIRPARAGPSDLHQFTTIALRCSPGTSS